MKVIEEYEVKDESTGVKTVCQTEFILLQYLSSLSTPTIVTVEKIVRTHGHYGVYGTTQSPFPSPPTTPVKTKETVVTKTHIDLKG